MKKVFSGRKRFPEGFLRKAIQILYHVGIVAFSAALAMSLPFIATYLAQKFLLFWSFTWNEKKFLFSIEVVLAVSLIIFSNFVVRSLKDMKLAKMARAAGLVLVTTNKGYLARRRIRKLKAGQGFARDIMAIGSTGFRTFVDSKGELYQVIQNCREAKIMLLNPDSEGARRRASSILAPDITPEIFGEQI